MAMSSFVEKNMEFNESEFGFCGEIEAGRELSKDNASDGGIEEVFSCCVGEERIDFSSFFVADIS